jgi:polysaccharide export outer membrane protein
MRGLGGIVVLIAVSSVVAWGQAPVPGVELPVPPDGALLGVPFFPDLPASEYRVGTDDLLDISVFEIEDLDSISRVSAAGYISMPLLGPVQATGLTPQELAIKIEDSLRANYVNEPHVTVFIQEYASQPVSIVGAVQSPAIYQIKGQKSLMEMMAMAGGLRVDAGSTIQVIRPARPLGQPIEGASLSSSPQTISISVEALFEKGQTNLNVPVYAGDTINVLIAGTIFVMGEVLRPDQHVLRNGRNVTVTQALALGGGLAPDAKGSETLIYRPLLDGTREEIPIDADKLMKGEIADVTMQPYDILFVPSSKAKPALRRALDTAIAVASGFLIYGVR